MPNTLTMRRRVSVKRYETETLTYRDAITAAGSSISTSSLDAVEQFVRSCKAAGIWAKLLDVGVFAGANLTAALVKLKHAGQQTLTNNNFVSGDYAETGVNGGLAGNGSTKFLGTGFNASTSLPDNCHLSFYLREDVAAAGNRAALGVVNGNEQYWLGALTPASDTTGRLGQLRAASQAAAFNKGCLIISRQAAASLKLYRGGLVVGSDTVAVVHTKPNFAINVFAWNSAGTAGAFLGARGSFYSIGDTLSDIEAMALNAAVQTLQAALNRAV